MAEEQKSGQQTKPKFPSEVVDLPSGGKLYSEDSPLRDGKIELTDNVSFSDKKLNLKLLSDNLNGNFNSGEFYSISPVKITFPSGVITSDNFSLVEKEKRLLFSGTTKLFLLK